MILKKQRKTTNTVSREDDRIISRVVWLDADREYSGEIYADVHTLKILDARMDILKMTEAAAKDFLPSSADNVSASDKINSAFMQTIPKEFRFDCLKGETAFIEGKSAIRRELSRAEDRIPSYLLQQAVNGIIQAETYFWKERGFTSEDAYNSYWKELEKNGCRMYSHPDARDIRWFDYAPRGPRQNNLFNRLKSTQIMEYDPCVMNTGSAERAEDFLCLSDFSDSFHEIHMEIICDRNGKIRDAQFSYLRAPSKVCLENCGFAASLSGKCIYDLSSRDTVELVGGKYGCYHLVEMLKDIIMTL